MCAYVLDKAIKDSCSDFHQEISMCLHHEATYQLAHAINCAQSVGPGQVTIALSRMHCIMALNLMLHLNFNVSNPVIQLPSLLSTVIVFVCLQTNSSTKRMSTSVATVSSLRHCQSTCTLCSAIFSKRQVSMCINAHLSLWRSFNPFQLSRYK